MLNMGLISPLVATSLVILFTIIYYWIQNRGTPPGPRGLPYLGLYPFINPFKMYLQLTEYAKMYRDVYSFKFSGRCFINLGSLKAIKEFHLANSEDFSGRPEAFSILTYTLGHGVATSNGEPWKELRKLYLNIFNMYGLINGSGDAIIKNIVVDLKMNANKSFDMVEFFTNKCMDTMRVAVFGNKGISDEEVKAFIYFHDPALENVSGTSIMLTGSFARFMYYFIPVYRRALNNHLQIRKLLLSVVQKITAKFDGENATCNDRRELLQRKE